MGFLCSPVPGFAASPTFALPAKRRVASASAALIPSEPDKGDGGALVVDGIAASRQQSLAVDLDVAVNRFNHRIPQAPELAAHSGCNQNLPRRWAER